MLSEYFRRELEAVGYEPTDVTWSLGYSQGDGMAFEARVDLEKVAGRLLAGPQKAAITRVIKKAGPSIRIRHSGHYSHWNSMNVDAEDVSVESDGSAFERKAWSDLVDAIDEDVKTISRRLETDGYSLLENCNPAWFVTDKEGQFGDPSHVVWRTFEIGRFRVVQKLVEDSNFDGYRFNDGLVKAIVKGETLVCGVEATVFDAERDIELGSASLWGITDAPNLTRVRQCLRETTREAIADARETINRFTGRAA